MDATSNTKISWTRRFTPWLNSLVLGGLQNSLVCKSRDKKVGLQCTPIRCDTPLKSVQTPKQSQNISKTKLKLPLSNLESHNCLIRSILWQAMVYSETLPGWNIVSTLRCCYWLTCSFHFWMSQIKKNNKTNAQNRVTVKQKWKSILHRSTIPSWLHHIAGQV